MIEKIAKTNKVELPKNLKLVRIKTNIEANANVLKKKEKVSIKELFSPKLRNATCLLMFLWFASAFCYCKLFFVFFFFRF